MSSLLDIEMAATFSYKNANHATNNSSRNAPNFICWSPNTPVPENVIAFDEKDFKEEI